MIRNRALSFALLTLFAAPLAFSQQPAPAPTAAAVPAPPMPPRTSRTNAARPMGGERHMEGGGPGLGILPPGTWWKNPDTITALSLTADQQKKMDDMFLQSRISLIHLHASLEEEQLKLEPLLNVNPDLEKSNAKMLLGLRSVLTADQWTKLQADQRTHHDHPSDGRGQGRGIGHGQGGPGGPKGQGPQGPGGPGGGPSGGPGGPSIGPDGL
jgi:hypothetical protein